MIPIFQMWKRRFKEIIAKVTDAQDDLVISHPNRDNFERQKRLIIITHGQ